MWARGDIANAGIQQIAETGAGEVFLEEVAACGADCGPPVQVPCDPMGGTCSGSGTVTVSPTTPYVSTAAMLAPSPDWCAPENRPRVLHCRSFGVAAWIHVALVAWIHGAL